MCDNLGKHFVQPDHAPRRMRRLDATSASKHSVIAPILITNMSLVSTVLFLFNFSVLVKISIQTQMRTGQSHHHHHRPRDRNRNLGAVGQSRVEDD
jgi:hypothetical protein